MKKMLMACGLFVLGLFTLGCSSGKNKCEQSKDEIEAKYDECGLTDPGSSSSGSGETCSEEMGTQSECVAKCTNSASCEALKKEDEEGATLYLQCLGNCV